MTKQEKKKVYKDKRWTNSNGTGARDRALVRDHYECQDCRERVFNSHRPLYGWESEVHPAEEVHHIMTVEERPDLVYELDNLVSLCTVCHNKRHGREPKKWNQRKPRLTEERW